MYSSLNYNSDKMDSLFLHGSELDRWTNALIKYIIILHLTTITAITANVNIHSHTIDWGTGHSIPVFLWYLIFCLHRVNSFGTTICTRCLYRRKSSGPPLLCLWVDRPRTALLILWIGYLCLHRVRASGHLQRGVWVVMVWISGSDMAPSLWRLLRGLRMICTSKSDMTLSLWRLLRGPFSCMTISCFKILGQFQHGKRCSSMSLSGWTRIHHESNETEQDLNLSMIKKPLYIHLCHRIDQCEKEYIN